MKKQMTALLLALLLLLTGCAAPEAMLSASAAGAGQSGKVLLPPFTRAPKALGDIVIYGGGFQAAAAANVAAMLIPEAHIYLIVPYIGADPNRILGSIGTVGGQNFFDIRRKKGILQTRGSFARWDSALGHFYSTEYMADILTEDVVKNGNVHFLLGYDVTRVEKDPIINRIHRIQVRKMKEEDGALAWDSEQLLLEAEVYVDASDDGRLARLCNCAHTVGRGDWPTEALDPGEADQPRQQAATLMFQVGGVEYQGQNHRRDMRWGCSSEGVRYGNGGIETYQEDPVVTAFNRTWMDQGFALKPINAAQDGKDSEKWWINALLVFNVDGRAHERDRGTENFPKDIRPDYQTVDEAMRKANELLSQEGPGSFIDALRQFGGFSRAYVIQEDGKPKTGNVLYVRETIHMSKTGGTYAVTDTEAHYAGDQSDNGADRSNYGSRIGLNFYWSDINAYAPEDLMDDAGNFIWGPDIARKLRPDLHSEAYPIDNHSPENPVFVPYQAMISEDATNLLVPGYAVSASSFAWSEMRVIPNLCVLGDAAGCAAAYAYRTKLPPYYFRSKDIEYIQDLLTQLRSTLEKLW